MTKKLNWLLIFIVLAIPLRGNDYPFTIEKGIGAALFPVKTYDEVWGAILKATLTSNYRLNVSEKEAGIIEAEHIRSGSTRAWVGKNTDEPRLSILIEKKEEGIYVSLKWDRGEKIVMRSMKSQREKIFRELFNKMAASLYSEAGEDGRS